MLGTAHVVMHLALCTAMIQAPNGTPMRITLHAQDRTGRLQWDRNWTVRHGQSREETVTFDAPYGTDRITISAPNYHCNAGDYLVFVPPHSRNIKETLRPGPPHWRHPTLLMGTAPQAFLYTQPTFVLLDAATKCKQEIDSTLPADIDVEYDPDSYYVSLYRMPNQALSSALLALQVESSTGDEQYLNLKLRLPAPWAGWPDTIRMNLPEGMLDAVATLPKGVLLCPKLYRASSG